MPYCKEFREVIAQKHVQILASIAATFGCFVYGVAHTWPAPGVPKMLANETRIVITRSEASWIASIHLCGQIISLPPTMYIVRALGCNKVILLSSIPLALSWLFIMFATNVLGVYAARIMIGLSNSFLYTSLPMYLGEITEPTVRGGLTSFLVIFFSLGTMFTFYFGYVMQINDFASIGMVLAVVYFMIFLPMPTSPVYLAFKKKVPEAKRVLKTLLQKSDVDVEYAAIEESCAKQEALHGNFFDLFRTKVNLSALGIMLLAISVVQFGGFSSITIYLHLVLIEAKVKMPVELASTLFSFVQLITCFIAAILVDRLGRRPLFIISNIGSAGCLLVLTMYFRLDIEKEYEKVALAALLLYIFIARVGVGVIPYVLRTEIFDNNIKQYGICVTNLFFSITGLLINKAFLSIADRAGMETMFGIFTVYSILAAVLIYFYIPETKNKSLAQIQEMILQRKLK